jgi:purine-binding chemotaxis protein CheW
MTEPTALGEKAGELRRRFDASFALPLSAGAAESEDLLNVRVGEQGFAIRLRDIAGLFSRRVIVPIPSRVPGVLGLAGIRGEVVPVFGLSGLLGLGQETEPPGWLVLSVPPQPIALAFPAFEGFVRLPQRSLHGGHRDSAPQPYLHEFITTGAETRAVISVPLLVSTIRSRLRPDGPNAKEQ